MKSIFKHLAVLAAFTIAFSSFDGCKGTSTVPGNGDSEATTNSNSRPVNSDPSTYPPLATGIANADIEFADGTKGKLADRKGKVVLVNLWGIWCGPCRAEMPHLVVLQEKYRDQGFQVIGLNIGDSDAQPENLDNIKAFGEKNKLNYELARAPRDMTAQIYRFANFDAVPLSLLIDRDGHVRGVLRGGGPIAIAQIQETVARAMGDTPSASN
jgi:thiol-disulfide isomerase/thioredoxin